VVSPSKLNYFEGMPDPARGSSTGRKGRPRIAFLAAYMNNAYEWDVWRAVRNAVEERGGTVLAFAGSGIEDPNPDRRTRADVFELMDPTNVDAILCLSSVVGQYAGIGPTEAWLERRGLPVSVIGPADRLPSVAIDDGSGITALMRHLIDQHGHRRIAFIVGSEANKEAQRRLSAYQKALTDHGIAPEPRLLLQGDFTEESGRRAIAQLFDTRQVRASDVHAVVASNDYMAFGAIDELARRRISVPEEIAVVGFDDIALARVYDPPLTTARQPLDALGRAGAHRLLELLEGRPVSGALTLQTELVLRRSCGCVPTDGSRPLARALEIEASPSGAHLVSGHTLLAALGAELAGEPGRFAQALEPLLRTVVSDGSGELHAGRRLADELATRVRLARDDLIHERLSRLARVLHTRMFGPQTQLSAALAEHLPAFGIDECAVSELYAPSTPGPARELKLAFGFNRQTFEPHIDRFDARQLIPDTFEQLRSRSAFVMPLTCGPQLLGIAVIPASPRDGNFYETLGELFATILKVLELRRTTSRTSILP
jgi:DNA-binding LacI/PurR family transcriptional regulator